MTYLKNIHFWIICDKYNKGRYEDIHVTNKKPKKKKTKKTPKHVCTNFIDGTIKIENQCRIQRYTEGLNALIESHQVVQRNYRTALACGIQFVSYIETVTSKNNNSMLKWRIFMPFLHLHKMHFRENPYNTKMIHYCLESISLLLSLACFTWQVTCFSIRINIP